MRALQHAVPVLLPSGANTSVFTAFWLQSQCAMHGRNIRVFQTSARHDTVSVENNMYTRSLEEA